MSLTKNTSAVFKQVAEACEKAQRSKESVTVIAVTKYVDSSIARKLVQLGARHLGENRVDAFLRKYEDLSNEPVVWHFIGSLQRRKVKEVINKIDYFHSLDSLKLAQEIQKRADHEINCFLQVNISQEASKHGFRVEELPEVLPQLADLSFIKIVGLMTMAPLSASESDILAIFQKTEQLRKTLQSQNWPNMPFDQLSMGMSQDYPLAIQAGSTYVRIGTAFFK